MLVTNIVNPARLSGFVRGLTFPDTQQLARFLPNVSTNAISYEFPRTDRTRRKAAQFRPFDVESPIGARPGVARVAGRIPPISKKMVLGEEEQLLADALLSQQDVSPEMLAQIYDDAANLTSDVLDRVEYARGQVLSTGKITFTNDLGFEVAEIDFGIPGSNFVTPAGALWTNTTTSVPITDMLAWIQNTYMPANGGARPVVGITKQATLTNLTLNTQVKSFLTTPAGAVPSILTPGQVQAVFSSMGLPPIVAIDEKVDLENAGVSDVLPDGKVIFLPAPSTERFGMTQFGPTVEGMNLAKTGFLTRQTAAGIVATNLITYDPQHVWTKVNALVVPTLKDPNAVMVATVA